VNRIFKEFERESSTGVTNTFHQVEMTSLLPTPKRKVLAHSLIDYNQMYRIEIQGKSYSKMRKDKMVGKFGPSTVLGSPDKTIKKNL